MRRGSKPSKAKAEAAEAKPTVAGKAPQDDSAKIRDLEKRLAEALRDKAEAQEQLQTRDRELVKAQEQQTATSEILRVISSSPTDVQPVFSAILDSAIRLCSAHHGILYLYDGAVFKTVAFRGLSAEAERTFLEPIAPGPATGFGRMLAERRPIQIADVTDDVAYRQGDPWRMRAVQLLSARSAVWLPLLKVDAIVGALAIYRQEVRPFSDKQIELALTFADQAVIAIDNVRLFNETKEALEQQTATAEILRVISSSPTDVQPVFDTIAESAVRLCDGLFSAVFTFDGALIKFVAHNLNWTPEGQEAFHRGYPRIPSRDTQVAQAILERAVIEVRDLMNDPGVSPWSLDLARSLGYRSNLVVPMLRDGSPIGAIGVARVEAGSFSAKQIELLKTFADQAIIAIENVRLFNETKEALEQQTATAEILRVISSSPTDLQPVMDAVAENAARVCGATDAHIRRIEGDTLRLVAGFGSLPAGLPDVYPINREYPAGRAVVERRTIHIDDILPLIETEYPRLEGTTRRTFLTTPLMREGVPIGVILIRRTTVQPFTDKQIALLETFADQAVIAIENVRLFTELQASNRELTTALDTQTATSDILRVISRSQTDVQPVFDAILSSAVRLLGAYTGVLTRIIDDRIELAALTRTDDAGDAAIRAAFPQPLQSEWPHAQAVRDRAPLNIADAQTDPRLPEAEHARARVRGFRSRVLVPMLRQDKAIGAISVARREPGGFKEDEIALLQTFADQAVIAIENARLFKELEARTQDLTRSVGELQALGEVGQAISSTLDLRTVLSTIVARATQLSRTDAGVIYEYDEQREIFVPRATEQLEAEIVETMLATPVRKGEGATGRLAELREPIQVSDILAAPAESRVRGALVRAGYRALLAVPLVREGHLIGGLTVIRRATGAFPPETIELLQTFATQSSLAIQNARLFREIEEKSRQLEAASQHKSEFLANMSHELRTPLNAIIGFSEVLTDRMFGELNEKQEEYLKDIYSSGTHLLSLINDILDLSKIEAGRMELELTDFHLPTALDNALTLVRERAGRRSITLEMSVDERLGEVRADERKIRQVVLNLLSNAIKFTPEGGRIEVAAMPKDGFVEVSVSDTGVGIAPQDQEAVFEEFRQVGAADKKAEGTGLGLTLCRKFIELHGGRIWVKSQLGAGSTFTFMIPVRCGE